MVPRFIILDGEGETQVNSGNLSLDKIRSGVRSGREFVMDRLRLTFEAIIANSRWLLAPFLLGLILTLAGLFYNFVLKLLEFFARAHIADPSESLLAA